MRVAHTSHALPAFPVYSLAFLSQNELVVGGGGGATKSGIKNKLKSFKVGKDRSAEQLDELELAIGEDAPMSMATDGTTVVCGVNSAPELLEKGENENCRVFKVDDGKLSFLRTQGTLSVKPDDLDYQKVTVLSPDGYLLAVAGPNDLSLLLYPSLMPAAQSLKVDKEIYDATFTKSTLIVATTAELRVYTLPETKSASPSKPKKKGKQKVSTSLPSLVCERVIDIPSSLGGSSGSSFRAAKIHPTLGTILYTVANTIPNRSRGKSTARQAHVLKWNTENWTVEKIRKVGDRDAATLNPVSTILKAHEFPPTTLAFNTDSSVLVSGSADNSIRVINLPDQVRGSNWGFFMLIILTLIVLLLAYTYQRYSNTFGW
ncbi:WD40 repeat-like protein [Lentinula edodes]|uniref:WD40 repeat-like protein n=1 Tax=Lentinula edodes TaxID=5353 RepID=A0A1Q3DWC6_LENED|nr:WD40 repeat-like protein [Lentinula edodes]